MMRPHNKRGRSIWRATSSFLLLTCLTLLCSHHGFAEPPVKQDPRISRWSELFREGQRDQLLRELERDLRSEDPHEFTSSIWVNVHQASHELKRAWDAVDEGDDQALKSALQTIAQMELLYDEERYQELKERFPLESLTRANAGHFEFANLGWSLDNTEDHRAQLDVTTEGLKRWPHSFTFLWNLSDSWRDELETDPEALAHILSLHEEGGPLYQTPSGRFMQAFTQHRPIDPLDQLVAVQAWIEEIPHDYKAHRFIAYRLVDLERYDEAIKAFTRCHELFPFFPTCLVQRGRWLARLERDDELKKVLDELQRLFKPRGSSAEVERAAWHVELLRQAGELGRARELAEPMLRDHPEHIKLLDQMAQIEVESKRHRQAAQLYQRLTRLKPQSATYLSNLIEELRESGQLEEAWSAFEEKRSLVPQTLWVRHEVKNLLEAQSRLEEAISFAEESSRMYPNSAWMLRNEADAFWAAQKPVEALKRLNASLDLDMDNDWAFGRLVEWETERGHLPELKQRLEELKAKYPWRELIWHKIAALLNTKDEKIAHWDEPRRVAPRQAWSWKAYLEVLMNEGRWDQSGEVAEEMLTQCDSWTRGERALAMSNYGFFLHHRAQKISITKEMAQAGIHALEKSKELGGAVSDYYLYVATLYLVLEEGEKAKSLWMDGLRMGVLNSGYYWKLFQVYTHESGEDAFIWMDRHVNRNPYDGQRLEQAAKYHAYWGGSPIVALSIYQLTKERAPDYYDKKLSGGAFGKLGDHISHFELYYAQTRELGESERYINWYESTRREAQGESKKVILDAEKTQVTILSPNGDVVVRRDHPITGKIMSLRRGSGFVEYTYDSRGKNLLSIKDSSGEKIRLTYDANDRIQTMITPSDYLSFEYNEIGKPKLISVKGVGQIQITYDSGGEVEEVNAFDGDHRIVLRVTQAFQELLSLVDHYKRSGQGGEIPEFPFEDRQLERLEARLDRAEAKTMLGMSPRRAQAFAKAKLAVAEHLFNNLQRRSSYKSIVRRHLEEVITLAQDTRLPSKYGLEAAQLWYRLMLQAHPFGLGTEDMEQWFKIRRWVEESLGDKRLKSTAQRIINEVEAKPLMMTPAARWLPRSHLSIPGYWRRYPLSAVFPETKSGSTQAQSTLVRSNGDVVVGTSAGLSVLRRGFWERFLFNRSTSRLISASPLATGGAASNVLSLTEDQAGRLWIGTAKGLLILTGDYEERLERIFTTEEGLPSPFVSHMMSNEAGVWVGTTQGLTLFKGGELTHPTPFKSLPKSGLRALSPMGVSGALVSLRDGLYRVDSTGEEFRLTDDPVDFAAYHSSLDRVITQLSNRQFVTLDPKGTGEPRRLDGAEDIISSKRVYQAETIDVDGAETTAILTDQGMSLYRDHHVEHFDLPNTTQRAGVKLLSQRGHRVALISSEGIFIYERDLVKGDEDGRVYDLLTTRNFTFVARGNRLEGVRHSDLKISRVANIDARHLRWDPRGRIITHDGVSVLSLDPDTLDATELFATDQTLHPRWRGSRSTIRDLLVARDGTIWAVAGASLFRYRDDEEVKEFGFFVDPEVFPSNTHMLSRVVETIDGEIWVVGSNEGHLVHDGVALRGGLLRWDATSDRFYPLKLSTVERFFTGYTQIDDETAIVGTLGGFYRHKHGQLKEEESPSYKAMIKDHPLDWYGTRGIQIAEGWWLFGSAGGVVGYHDGQWFYPDRLNWMLPQQELSQYGGRHTYALSTDHLGRIYVGTNQGLMIYEGSRGDPSTFLLSNGLTQQAFGDREVKKLEDTSDVLLSHVDPESEVGKTSSRLKGLRQEIEMAERRLAMLDEQRIIMVDQMSGARVEREQDRDGDPSLDAPQGVDRAALEQELKEKRKAHADLLLRLEHEDPSLYQMLEFKPLDLASLRRDLGPEDLVLQYLPSRGDLYIQMVTRDGEPEVREVKVSREELFTRASLLSRRLGGHLSQARGARRLKQRVLSRLANQDGSALNVELAWLYDKLLRPVEHEAHRYKRVYLVTTGALAYVPFEALVRREKPFVEYAVEHFNFSYLPSLYLFQIMRANIHTGGERSLVLADPDGSLPGARGEAGEIAKLIGSRVDQLIGSEATYDALIKSAPQSRLLHLATHGVLNQHRPERSYLLLADKRRITVPDIMTLPLARAEMVVLSACESGIGVNGLEYATLARAFMHAGASSIIATLWQVEDESSKELMKVFYERLKAGDDRIVALAKAKRALIKADREELHHPSRWSPYILFGEP